MDAFILAAKDLSYELLPILGVIVLVMLIVLLSRLIKLVTKISDTLLKTHTTIDLIDTSIEKVQAPLDTAIRLSGTVDDVHEAGIEMVKNTKVYLDKNKEEIKDKVSALMTVSKDKIVKYKKTPGPEDIIGGK